MSRLSVIIAAYNEAKQIGPLVRRLLRWRRNPEVIVISNGSTDGTARIARGAGARVIHFRNKLGPDVGRAIGLSVASGDMYLVVDADMLIPLSQLEPFVEAVEHGVDVALNGYPFWGTPQFHHPTAIAKHALNAFSDRNDLRAASLTAVPHALSRQAVRRLGPLAFSVPPMAQVRAILQDLRVEVAGRVAVGKMNKRRGVQHERTMRQLIIGDCLEAMHTLISSRGRRGGHTDLARKRDLIRPASEMDRIRVASAAVVPTQGEDTISSVLEALRASDIQQVRVVLNGLEGEVNSRDSLFPDFRQAHIDYYRDAVGHDVGRAIGCAQVDSDAYFIADSDIPIAAADVQNFLDAVNSGVDVALNRIDDLLSRAQQTDPPSVVKRFLNITLGRPDLGIASLTAVPHALSRRAVETVGLETLAVPPLAQAKAIVSGLDIAPVHAVDVIQTNAKRPDLHSERAGRPLQHLILGDHVEAIAYLQSIRGPRCGFDDTLRRRDIATRYILKREKGSNSNSVLLTRS